MTIKQLKEVIRNHPDDTEIQPHCTDEDSTTNFDIVGIDLMQDGDKNYASILLKEV